MVTVRHSVYIIGTIGHWYDNGMVLKYIYTTIPPYIGILNNYIFMCHVCVSIILLLYCKYNKRSHYTRVHTLI